VVLFDVNGRKAECLANQVTPGLDLFEFPGPDQFPVIGMTLVAPNPAIKDQIPMIRRV